MRVKSSLGVKKPLISLIAWSADLDLLILFATCRDHWSLESKMTPNTFIDLLVLMVESPILITMGDSPFYGIDRFQSYFHLLLDLSP